MRQVYRTHKVIRLVSAGAIATMLSGVASAATSDSTVTYTNTGSDSNQTTTITNTTESTVTNTNDIFILNVNSQQAETGKVEVQDNTAVEGAVGSGDATNTNTTATDVTVNNQAVGGAGGGGAGGGGAGGATGGLGGGSALGAATGGMGGGAAVLPEVGASTPMDLSALRSLYGAGNGGLAAGSNGLDLGYLIPAFLLSTLAAVGTVIRQKRRQLVTA